jgi:polyhydroxybutyrate depolymerase
VKQRLAAVLLAQAAALAVEVGCASAVDSLTSTEPISDRPYQLFTQRGRDPKRPAAVVFALHAYGAHPDFLLPAYALQRRVVAKRGWILVVPEGTRDAGGRPFWNASAACCGIGGDRPDDLGYLHRILDALRRRTAVDAERVFAIGVSNGAFMAHRWACAPAGDLRAIVSISGAGQGPQDPPCAPSVPVSVLHIHGDRDPIILYQGGERDHGRYPSARESAEAWRRLNVCDANASPDRRWGLFLGPLQIESWSCPRARVSLWTVEGGSHNLWTMRFSVEEILEFLEKAPPSTANRQR